MRILLTGQLGRFQGRDDAPLVLAVGDQDHDPGALGALTQLLHPQSHGIAHGGGGSGDGRHQFIEQLVHRRQIESQRR